MEESKTDVIDEIVKLAAWYLKVYVKLSKLKRRKD